MVFNNDSIESKLDTEYCLSSERANFRDWHITWSGFNNRLNAVDNTCTGDTNSVWFLAVNLERWSSNSLPMAVVLKVIIIYLCYLMSLYLNNATALGLCRSYYNCFHTINLSCRDYTVTLGIDILFNSERMIYLHCFKNRPTQAYCKCLI